MTSNDPSGPSKLLVKNATLISVDPTIGNVSGADILIEGREIVDVGHDLPAEGCEVFDATHHIVAPGMIDTHRHLWQSIIKYVGADWSTPDYYHGVRGVFGRHFRAEDIYAGNLLGAVEGLDAGVTSVIDCCHNLNSPEHADAAVEALKESGMRAVFAHGNANADWVPLVNDSRHSEDAIRVKETHFASDDQLVTMALCLRGPQWSPDDVVEWEFKLARDMGLRITFPVGMGKWAEVTPIEKIASMGLAGDDIVYSHANVLTDNELRIIADSGGHVAITPERELTGGSSTVATGRLLEYGIRPSIGVDMNTAVAGDLFVAMRQTLTAERSRQHGINREAGRESTELALSAYEAIEFATIEGAKACGLDHVIGSVTPGKQADLVFVNTRSLNMAPLNNPVGAFVFGANKSDVTDVMVAGRFVKRDGSLVDISVDRVLEVAEKSRDHIMTQAGKQAPSFDWRLQSSEWTAAASRSAPEAQLSQ